MKNKASVKKEKNFAVSQRGTPRTSQNSKTNHRNFAIKLSAIFILLAVVFGTWFYVLSVNWENNGDGQQVSLSPVKCASTSCIDSDRGAVPNTAGTAEDNCMARCEDTCMLAQANEEKSTLYSRVLECFGSSCFLNECFCDEGNNAQVTKVSCGAGEKCRNGACVILG